MYKCYELAGYKCDTPGWTLENKGIRAKTILERPHVQAYIHEQQQLTNEKLVINREWILTQHMEIIKSNDPKRGAAAKQKSLDSITKMCGFDKPDDSAVQDDDSYFELPARCIGRSFSDIYRDIHANKYREYWFEGGRGSLKSSFVSLAFIELFEQNPNMCGIAVRNVTTTIGDSIFAQLVWAIEYLNLQDDYKWIKSPFEITKKSTGQKIYFRGMDDATKIKSIKPPLGKYLAIQWFEEFDQIKGGMAAVRIAEQSLVRGGDIFYRFKSYNTPQSNNHFVNVEKILPKPDRLVHKSNYLEAPVEWLGQAFIDEAAYLKDVNPTAYANEYMGEITGTGGMVFTNLDIRPITDIEKAEFDYEYQGLDFGWFPDPNHWSCCYYSPKTRTLYITDEYRSNKRSPADIYRDLVESCRLKDYVCILADYGGGGYSIINDMKDCGAFIKPCPKPSGSVNYGVQWLANLNKIVIDPKCRETAKEFSKYELEKDKDGNYISVFPDKDNHSIDSVRYAMFNVLKRKGW